MLAVGGYTGAVVLLVLSVVSILLVPVGVGIVTTPWVLTGVRAFADRRRSRRRRVVRDTDTVHVPEPARGQHPVDALLPHAGGSGDLA